GIRGKLVTGVQTCALPISRLEAGERPLFVLLLAPGSEFAFVLLGPTAAGPALSPETAHALFLAVALSMLATPLALALHDRLLARSEERRVGKECRRRGWPG